MATDGEDIDSARPLPIGRPEHQQQQNSEISPATTSTSSKRPCAYGSCRTQPSYNIKGIRSVAYCKRHAHEGMVNVYGKRCHSDSCTKRPSFNFEGSKNTMYCKEHADQGMVNIVKKRCAHASCTSQPTYNVEGTTTPLYCALHAEDGMVSVSHKRCKHVSCIKQPSFNVAGEAKAVYCKQHAQHGMVDVANKRCSHDACTERPKYNTVGGKPGYCKQHAEDGMVFVLKGCCSHDSCNTGPGWGAIVDSSPSVCARHKSDISGGLAIDFKAKCKVAGCGTISRWGLDGHQPTYCSIHGPLENGLVCILKSETRKKLKHCPSNNGVGASSFTVKTQIDF